MLSAFVTAAEESSESINPLIPTIPDLVWGTFAFLIVLALFFWKVLPALNKALDARSEAIEGGLKKAEEAQAQADAALQSYTDQLVEARAEANRIREQARADGTKIIAELKEQATVEADRIKVNAMAQIEAERSAALVSLRGEVGSLALDLAGGVVGETLSDDARAAGVVDRFLKDLEASR